jgi:Domain of unknown function (DUF4188)
MANITGRRMMAEIDGDFVVFLIGARFNSFHVLKTVLDLGGRRGMKHMLDYLVAHPEKGLLGYQMGLPTIVQYWRSFDHLEAFANDRSDPHVAAWRNYWKRVGTLTLHRAATHAPGINGEDSGCGEVCVDHRPLNVPHSGEVPRCLRGRAHRRSLVHQDADAVTERRGGPRNTGGPGQAPAHHRAPARHRRLPASRMTATWRAL